MLLLDPGNPLLNRFLLIEALIYIPVNDLEGGCLLALLRDEIFQLFYVIVVNASRVCVVFFS